MLPDGTEVAVKVLRPNIKQVIDKDISLIQTGAMLVEKLWSDGKRLKPRAVVAEFEKTLADELDLSREAANCSQLRRNFRHSPLLLVPAVHWDWSNSEVMVMERMAGIPIGHVERLVAAGVDLKRLSRAGVELFFTQVFRDGYFHADMHPGNIFVATDGANFGKYIAMDFGIMGTLSERDKSYLAQNFLAFFRRDYHRVATAHLESGWVPPGTRVDELEAEIRVVLEPVFDRPLSEISLGRVLMQLFRASRRFSVEIQPQLVLLQKTLLNVEGLGRQLDPSPRLVDDREAVPRALDGGADRPAPRCAGDSSRRRRTSSRRCRSCRAFSTSGCSRGRRHPTTRCASSRRRSGRATDCWWSCCCCSPWRSCCSCCGHCSPARCVSRRQPDSATAKAKRPEGAQPARARCRQRRAPQKGVGFAEHQAHEVLERRLADVVGGERQRHRFEPVDVAKRRRHEAAIVIDDEAHHRHHGRRHHEDAAPRFRGLRPARLRSGNRAAPSAAALPSRKRRPAAPRSASLRRSPSGSGSRCAR